MSNSPTAAVTQFKRIPYPNCPLCDGQQLQLHASASCSGHALYDARIPPAMNWLECQGCGHVFTEGYFGGDIEAVLFSRVHPQQLPGHNPELGRAIAARIVDRVSEYVAPGGTWLDVGFGDGALLSTAAEWGFEAVGIDTRPRTVATAADLLSGVRVYRADIAAYQVSGAPCRVISMADVLEHMPYPKDALRLAFAALESDGALFVSCPNMDCVAWRRLTNESANPYWGEIEHFHNFSRKRLTSLLAECGFTVVRYGVSERYRLGMELIAVRADHARHGASPRFRVSPA